MKVNEYVEFPGINKASKTKLCRSPLETPNGIVYLKKTIIYWGHHLIKLESKARKY